MASISRPPRVQNQVRTTQPDSSGKDSSDWKEETSMSTGKKYYYNKRTKMASWAKPYELMTPSERLIAPTNWIEAVAASNGKMFYFNTVTQESMWSTPDEVKRVNVAATDWREEQSREGKRYWYNTVTQVSQWATPAEVKLARARANMNPSDVQAQMEDAEELAREQANLNLARERANLDLNLPAPMEDNEELPREVEILNDVPAQAPAEDGPEKAGELAEAVENLSVEAPLPPKKKRAWRLMDEE